MGDLSPPTIVCLGSRCSFLETPLKNMRRFYLTGTKSGSSKLGSIVSSSLIWNRCFRYHICSPCLFPCQWTGIWSKRNRVSQSGGSLIALLFPLAIVGGFLNYSQAQWNRSFLGETPKQAATFISRFMKVKGKFFQSDFRAPGWMYSITASWWTHPQRIRGTTAPVRIVSCDQDYMLWDCPKPL